MEWSRRSLPFCVLMLLAAAIGGSIFAQQAPPPAESLTQLEEAVRLDPGYPDAHYNLALVYEKLGLHGKARQQWRSYLKLDSRSHWSLYARQQLEKTPLRLVRRKKSPEEDSNRFSR